MIDNLTGLTQVSGPFAVSALHLTISDKEWAFGVARRGQIDAYFDGLRAENPSLFNGPILLIDEWKLEGGAFHGHFCQTDFAGYVYWRNELMKAADEGVAEAKGADTFPAFGCRNLFGAAAARSAEGHLLLGEMGPQTFHAGKVYCPCGSLDAEDAQNGLINIDRSMARELAEETGLDLSLAQPDPNYQIWFDGPQIAVIRNYRFEASTSELETAIRAHLASEDEPELSDVKFVKGVCDVVEGAMQPYTVAMISDLFGGGQGETG